MNRSAPAAEQPMELVFADTPPPPKEIPKPLPKPVVHQAPVKQAVPLPTPPQPAPAPVVPDSPVAVAATPPTPPPAQHSDKTAEREAEFAAKVRAAIQAAVVYPPAARTMGYRGKARVEFIFRDGVPHQVHIVQGSGVGMIDTAALAAVANAQYPIPPDTLKGRDVPYQVVVLFELSAAR